MKESVNGGDALRAEGAVVDAKRCGDRFEEDTMPAPAPQPAPGPAACPANAPAPYSWNYILLTPAAALRLMPSILGYRGTCLLASTRDRVGNVAHEVPAIAPSLP